MKVLFVTNYPAPYRVDFFNQLGKKIKLTVLFEEEPKNQKHREGSWFNSNYNYFKPKFLKQTKIGNKISINLDITKHLKKSYDMIILGNYSSFTGMYAIYYMNKNNIDFAIEADGAFPGTGRGIKERLKHYLISSASWWFSTNDITDEYFMLYGANKNQIYRYLFTSLLEKDILKNPLNSEEKNDIRKKLNINEENVIISVGQFSYRKGFDVLIESAKYLDKSVGVYIIGGKAPTEYIDKRNRLGLSNIHFIDFKPKGELFEYYKASDLFVFPTRMDIWGLVVNEAMAVGLPVITTDKCGSGLELIDNEKNGFIVPIEDSQELAKKINVTISDKSLIKRMSENNIRKIRGYTIENMAKRHIEIFKKIIDDK